jgi:multidrug efflux system membrane fusion protein
VDEAARQLHCPRGTVASRLARARAKLSRRLTRRGVTLTAGGIAAVLAEPGLAAAVPDALIQAVVRMVTPSSAGPQLVRTGLSIQVTALTEEVLKAMLWKKLVIGSVAAILIAGAFFLAYGASVAVRAGAETQLDAPPSSDEPPVAPKSVGPVKQVQVVPPAKSVDVSQPVAGEETPFESFTGRLVRATYVEVYAQVAGVIGKVHVKTGDEVKKGNVLLEIQDAPYRALLDATRAEGKIANEKLAQIENQLRHERELLANGQAKPEEVKAIEVQRVVARAALDAELAKVSQAQQQLEATKIRAPVNGRVFGVHGPGAVIDPERSPGPVASIQPARLIGVEFEMDERSYLHYQRLRRAGQTSGTGSPLMVGLSDETTFPHKGFLARFGDQFNPKTGTITVTGTIPNADPILLPGMFARVRVPFGKPRPVLHIASAAVWHQGTNRYFVWVVNDQNRIEQRPVKVLSQSESLTAVTEGLKPQDWVVVRGVNRVRIGDQVERRRAENGDATPKK